MIRFKKTILSNGIRVVSESHPQSRAVSLGVWVLTGTRDEEKNQYGISHFLEHMVFKGTRRRTAYQIAKSLEALGGDLNAYTTKEYTCYHSLVLSDHWTKSLDVLSDLVSNMQFGRKDFLLEKNVILQEIASGEDNLEEMIYDIFFEKVYAGHSLATPILGTPESIQKMNQKNIIEYYKNNYTGSQLIVSAAGNIDHQELVEAIEKKLGNKKKIRKKDLRKSPKWNVVKTAIEKPSEQMHILLGFPTASFKDKFRFEAFILNTLLGGGMTSKLYQSVREKKGLVYTIHSSLNTFTDSGSVLIYAAADKKNVKKVVQIISKELRRIRKEGVSQHELDLYKTQVIGSILLGSDDIENRMTSIGVNEMVFEKYKSVEDVINEINNITKKSVNTFIKDKLDLDLISGVILGSAAKELEPWWTKYKF